MSYTEDIEKLDVEKRQLENELLKGQLTRQKQELDLFIENSKRRETKADRIYQARASLDLLMPQWMSLVDKGNKRDILGLEDIIKACLKIMGEVLGADEAKEGTVEVDLSHAHLTAADIKNALANTDVLSVISKARRNGWIVSIDGNAIVVKRAGKAKDEYVSLDPLPLDTEGNKCQDHKPPVSRKKRKG